MKSFIYFIIIILLTIMLGIFIFQNLENVTLNFLSTGFTSPLTVSVFFISILGVVTGGLVTNVIRSLVSGAVARNNIETENGR